MLIILLAGFGVIGWMFYQSMKQARYVEVAPGSGTHIQLESHGKQGVTYSYQESKGGNFKQQSNAEILGEIPWSVGALFCFLLALVFMVGRDVAYMWRIRLLTKKELSWRRSFRVIMLWEFASALSPGVVGGSAVAMFILHRERINLGRSTAIVVLTALMDNLFYVCSIPIVFLFVSMADVLPGEPADYGSLGSLFWWGYLIVLIVTVFLFASIFLFPELILRVLLFFFQIPWLKRWRAAAIKTGEDIALAARTWKEESWTFWLKSFLATVLSWTSRYLVVNSLLAAFLFLSWGEHLFVLGKQLILWLLMLVSPTPGASGVAEFAFGEIMSDLGASALIITLVALIWRLISYFPYLLIGLLILPGWMRKTKAPIKPLDS